MNILEALGNLRTIQVFGNSFTKNNSNTLTIARNVVSPSINILNGTNTIGKLSTYDQDYSMWASTATLNNTTIYHGNVYYDVALNTTNYLNIDFSDILQPTPFQYVGFSNQLIGYSNYLRTISQNGSKRYQSNIYSLSGTEEINYINFGATEINNLLTCTTLKFNFNKDSLVILNFSGATAAYFNNIEFQFVENKINEANVIFNFESNNVFITGTFNGNILYTTGTVNLDGATVNGSVYANTIVSTLNTTINDSVIYDVNSLPVKKLEAPAIEISNDIENNIATVSISSLDTGTIYYKVDLGDYQEYTSEFTIVNVGTHSISTYISDNGFTDSDITTGEVIITCQCDNPTIAFNSTTNTLTFNSNIADSRIYFTTNGELPNSSSQSVLVGGTYKIPYDGAYEVIAYASNGICTPSGNTHKVVIASYPIEILTINVLSTLSGSTYVDEGGNGVRVEILKNSSSSSKIYYTEDGTNPMYSNRLYNGIFYTKSNKILAVIRDEFFGYSKIAEKDIIIGGAFYVEKSNSELNSTIRVDTIANSPTYGLDIGWIGPSVIVDDTSIYQALVNILSTPVGSVPFNLTFGVSITNSLFELLDNFKSEQVIADLKSEIEYNDPRIYIDDRDSYAYFVEQTNQLVIDLSWLNRYTKEKAHIKYGYNLDGIL